MSVNQSWKFMISLEISNMNMKDARIINGPRYKRHHFIVKIWSPPPLVWGSSVNILFNFIFLLHPDVHACSHSSCGCVSSKHWSLELREQSATKNIKNALVLGTFLFKDRFRWADPSIDGLLAVVMDSSFYESPSDLRLPGFIAADVLNVCGKWIC